MKPKQKSSIKQKIKNFFTIPDEVFEEEPSPQFERQKLFILNKTRIFFGILTFLILVNILIFFNLNQFYIRAVLAFIFLITVPGLLIMLMLKIRSIGFWEYLVYTVGLSVSFIMFAGLAVNWILPWLNITDKPLSLYPILACFDLFLLIFLLIAYIRNKDMKPFDIKTPKLDAINNIFFIIPMFFPVLSILGAFLLNNHGTNILTMIMLGGIAVYVLLLTIFRKRLDKNIYPWALYLIGLSLLLMFSMRSWFISGYDISNEYHVFNLASTNQIWLLEIFHNAYNACISINILPSIILQFVNIIDIYIFKFLYPIIFSLILIPIFLISNRYLNSRLLSFLSSFIFLSFIWFIDPMATLTRQQIAFLFFSLISLLILKESPMGNYERLFFIIFSFSLVLSHYSTAYFFLFFLLFYTIFLLFKNFHKLKKSHINFVLILICISFCFLWYSQLTQTSDNIFNVGKNVVVNMGTIFSDDLRHGFLEEANPFSNKKSNSLEEIKSFVNEESSKMNNDLSPQENTSKYSFNLNPPKSYLDSFGLKNGYIFQKTFLILQIIFEFGMVIGITIFLFNKRNSFSITKIFIIFSFIMLSLIIVLPFFSLAYNLDRLFMQTNMVLCIMILIGLKTFCERSVGKFSTFTLVLIILCFFLFNYGFIWQLSGGKPVYWLNSEGNSYDIIYTHYSEVSSIRWIKDKSFGGKIYANGPTEKRLWAYAGIFNIHTLIVPSTIVPDKYILSSYSNKIYERGFLTYRGIVLGYNFPTKFINENENKIYNNGGSEIFK